MRAVNEFLATGPFDLYELKLFHLVAEHRNFTRAGQAAGLTQSAITRQSVTGQRLQAWLERSGVRCEPSLEADNFDFIVNLVSLGLGASLVPHRALALHPRTRPVLRVRTEPRFRRELAVVVSREAERSAILAGFLENVLF